MANQISEISSSNDLDYYFGGEQYTGPENMGFMLEIKKYFEKGGRAGFWTPLEALNLFDRQLDYFEKNAKTPFRVLNYFRTLPLTPEQLHVLLGMILKFYGGYPIRPVGGSTFVPLIILEGEFLSYTEHSPDKDFAKNPDLDGRFFPKFDTKPFPGTFKYTEKDFAGIAENKDIDFYFDTVNIPCYALSFDVYDYFRSGEREGLIEPLAFLNLLNSSERLIGENPNRPIYVVETLKSLSIPDEIKHILFGFLLKRGGGNPPSNGITDSGRQIALIRKMIYEEFNTIPGDTPEKANCLRSEVQKMVDYYERRELTEPNEWDQILAECKPMIPFAKIAPNNFDIQKIEHWYLEAVVRLIEPSNRASTLFISKDGQYSPADISTPDFNRWVLTSISAGAGDITLSQELAIVETAKTFVLAGLRREIFFYQNNLTGEQLALYKRTISSHIDTSNEYLNPYNQLYDYYLRKLNETETELGNTGYKQRDSLKTKVKEYRRAVLTLEYSMKLICELQGLLEILKIEEDNDYKQLTEGTIENESTNESRTKKLITEKFNTFDNEKWRYAFHSERDYNLFVDLLTGFFEDESYTIPETVIRLKKGCKTRVAKLLGEIHKDLSENPLAKDNDYLKIVKVLSHFKEEPSNNLIKSLQR